MTAEHNDTTYYLNDATVREAWGYIERIGKHGIVPDVESLDDLCAAVAQVAEEWGREQGARDTERQNVALRAENYRLATEKSALFDERVATVTALREQVAALTRDAERLDWLESKTRLANGVTIERQHWSTAEQELVSVSYEGDGEPEQTFLSWGAKLGHFRFDKSLRAAIDAARRGPTEERNDG
jgi:hypothetical protein